MSTLSKLGSLTDGIQVAVAVAEVGVPLVTGVIAGIRKIVDANGQDTQDYEVVLRVGNQDLLDADTAYQSTIDKVNAELTRLGKPTI